MGDRYTIEVKPLITATTDKREISGVCYHQMVAGDYRHVHVAFRHEEPQRLAFHKDNYKWTIWQRLAER